MLNYYEILQVASTATTTDIEVACEAHYNRWRRLVTHHDSSVVAQANQALQQLEQIRATLTDPQKRVQ
jgi:DnaJ-class molecular chaperone